MPIAFIIDTLLNVLAVVNNRFTHSNSFSNRKAASPPRLLYEMLIKETGEFGKKKLFCFCFPDYEKFSVSNIMERGKALQATILCVLEKYMLQ